MTIEELKTNIEHMLDMLTTSNTKLSTMAQAIIIADCSRNLENFLYDEYGYNIDDLI